MTALSTMYVLYLLAQAKMNPRNVERRDAASLCCELLQIVQNAKGLIFHPREPISMTESR
jgi:hypothetical protein